MAMEATPEHIRAISKTLGRSGPELEGVALSLKDAAGRFDPNMPVALMRTPSGAPIQQTGGGLGDLFVKSEAYRQIADPDNRPHTWTSGPVDLTGAYSTKGTLLETVGQPPTPPYYPGGVVEGLLRAPTIASLLGQGQTTAGVIKYPEETTTTNAAAVTAQADPKPESTIALTERTVSVDKIATFLPVADEMLEDAPSMSAYLNQRLSAFIAAAEDTYLFSKLVNSGVSTYAATGSGTLAVEGILRAFQGARGSYFLEPDAVIINPTSWGSILLSRDTTNSYYAGPFTTSPDSIWGVRVLQTTAIGAGSALFGPFRQTTQLFRRSGPSVEVTNSHSDWFQKNLSALRAETRLAAAIYRPASLVKVTGI